MRQGIAQLIEHEPDLAVCGEAELASEALQKAQELMPDLMLIDITLPDKNGLELIKDIQFALPKMPVLVLSMHDESLYVERVLRAGGRGYVMKQEGGEKLMAAIRRFSSAIKCPRRFWKSFRGAAPRLPDRPWKC